MTVAAQVISALAECNEKVLCFGEIHGILELTPIKLGVLREWLLRGHAVAVLLERDHDQQDEIDHWLQVGRPRSEYRSRFEMPLTSSFLSDQYEWLSGLADLARDFPEQLRALCMDLSFTRDPHGILRLQDEDEFDRAREEFIISRIQDHEALLSLSDRILWSAGNMHAAKEPFYFPLQGSPSRHIQTSAMWLDERFNCRSVFCLPLSGSNLFQKDGSLPERHFEVPSGVFAAVHGIQGTRLVKTVELSQEACPELMQSYDWLLCIEECTPSKRFIH